MGAVDHILEPESQQGGSHSTRPAAAGADTHLHACMALAAAFPALEEPTDAARGMERPEKRAHGKVQVRGLQQGAKMLDAAATAHITTSCCAQHARERCAAAAAVAAAAAAGFRLPAPCFTPCFGTFPLQGRGGPKKFGAALGLDQFAKAKTKQYDKREIREKERALNAAKVNKLKKLKKRLGDKLEPKIKLPQVRGGRGAGTWGTPCSPPPPPPPCSLPLPACRARPASHQSPPLSPPTGAAGQHG